jgi:peptidoglycan/LPS O-acetylase OafA/YrhL
MSADRHNNFDFIRFTAATMVWYGHCYALYGKTPDAFTHLMHFGYLGVAIFFVISGYFVTRSYETCGSLLHYLRNRVLRIVPAMAVVLLLTVFLLGPLTTSLTLHQYFAYPDTWRYFNVFPPQYTLPGVFASNPLNAVNGSLWTLQYEMICYAGVAIFGVLGILFPRPALMMFAALWSLRIYGMLANIDLVPPMPFFHQWSWEPLERALKLETLFTSGAFMYIARSHIPLKKEYFALACLLITVGLHYNTVLAANLLFDIALPYAVIYLGFLKLPLLSGFGKHGDFSYGLYLYAYPLQQLVLHFCKHISFTGFLAVSFACIFICALTSWHFIEKPALQLKR